EWALGHRLAVVLLGFGSLAGTLALAQSHIGMELFPSVDQGAVRVLVEMAPGSPLKRTDATVQRMEGLILHSGVEKELNWPRCYATIGEISGGVDRLPERGPGF